MREEPFVWSDMSREQQQAADSIVGDFGANLSEHMLSRAESLERQAERSKPSTAKTQRTKAERLRKASKKVPKQPMTRRRAANARVKAVESAASDDWSLPGESLAGSGWYFDSHEQIAAAAPHLDRDTAITASSVMSPGTNPVTERAALGALAHAYMNDSKVHIDDDLAHSLASEGVSVPDHLIGGMASMHEIPSHVLAAMAAPEHRDLIEERAPHIDFGAIGGVSSPANIARAADIITGQLPVHEAQNPYSAPKTWSYTEGHRVAVPGSPEHFEYALRASHLADTIRGDQVGAQQMFDYEGLRASNEGVLSNARVKDGHTAEDSWMFATSVGITDPSLFKAGGDVTPGAKTAELDGQRVSVSSDPRVGANAMYHAWNHEATTMAAERLQRKYDLEYTVPAMLVQETTWTANRRRAGGDSDFNKQRKQEAKEAKQEAKRQAAEDRASRKREGKQLTLDFSEKKPRRSRKKKKKEIEYPDFISDGNGGWQRVYWE